ncbi:MAG: hypothetical protein D4R66_01700 [Opitutales bacterium]|nr:MAG: hypothetical protein D4R66_01700 [Opitutales bacterium]
MGEILGIGTTFPILISEAGVGFSLGQVDQLTGWPERGTHSWQVDTLTRWQEGQHDGAATKA